jgi:hypothetical protein
MGVYDPKVLFGSLTVPSGAILSVQGSFVLGGTTLSEAELGYLDSVTPGTVSASKAVVVDANKDIATFRHLTLSGNLIIGSTTLTEAELAVLDAVVAGTVVASKALVVDASRDLATLHDVTLDGDLITGSTTLTEAELAVLDAVTAGTVAASKALVVDASRDLATLHDVTLDGLLHLNAAAGAAAANALLAGRGTSADPATTSEADKSFLEFRTESEATTGDSRGGYFRHALAGAGGSGESLRGNTNLYAAAANAHGVHGSVAHQTGGSITGQSAGLRGGWILPDAAVAAGGTYYGTLAEIYVSGDSSDPSAVTQHAVLGVIVGGPGDATAQNKVLNMMAFAHGGTDGTGNAIYSHSHTPGDAAGSIRVLINGAVKYIKFWDAE